MKGADDRSLGPAEAGIRGVHALGEGVLGRRERFTAGAAAALGRWLRGPPGPREPKQRSLVVAPALWGSLGDEAIVQGVVEALRGEGSSSVGMLYFGADEGWTHMPGIGEMLRIDDLVLRGRVRGQLRLALCARRYDHLYLIGTDVLDGYYSERRSLRRLAIAQLAAAAGLRVTLVGFSIGEDPKASCLRAFERLDPTIRVCCRDEVSAARLKPHLRRPPEVTADAAFLLEPDVSSPAARHALAWIEAEKFRGRLVIGLNVNQQLVRSAGSGGMDALIRSFATALPAVSDSLPGGASFVFLPHDLRPGQDDRSTGRELLGALPERIRRHATLLPDRFAAADVKGIAGYLALVVSGRMHVAIAALGRGVPAACLTYVGKFEGLLRHFGIEHVTLSPTEAMEPARLTSFVREAVVRRKELELRVAAALPGVLRLARSNVVPDLEPWPASPSGREPRNSA